MVESFQSGVLERFGELSAALIPLEDDLLRCSQNKNCDLWAVILDGVPAGAIFFRIPVKLPDISFYYYPCF